MLLGTLGQRILEHDEATTPTVTLPTWRIVAAASKVAGVDGVTAGHSDEPWFEGSKRTLTWFGQCTSRDTRADSDQPVSYPQALK